MIIPVSNVDRVLKKAWTIPGLYRRDEAAFLYGLASRPGNLVEIGSWMGRTSSILVQAAAAHGGEVFCVDPFAPMPAGHKQGSAKRWRANLEGAGLVPPTLMEMQSDVAAPLFEQPIALLFIDGNHSRESVMHDLIDWASKIVVGGTVALHDMFYPSIPGVCLAVCEWWAREHDGDRPRWGFLGHIDYTIAFKRLI